MMQKGLLNRQETIDQSERAYNRWKDLWIDNCNKNKTCLKQLPDIMNKCKGKKAVLFSYGPSFEKNIYEVLKNELHHEYDILCVDKALKKLVNLGVYPQFVHMADAQVSFEEYGNVDPIVCKKTTLISSVTGNSKWVQHWTNNGGKVYFTINKDGILTHKIYRDLIDYRKGEAYIIPASSNVGNALYVIAALILGYYEILLAGYDYSYKLTGDYYGDKSDPLDTNHGFRKKVFNNHDSFFDINGDLVQVSGNMKFSAKWLIDFIHFVEKSKRNVTYNITGAGILGLGSPIKQANIRRAA